MYSCSFMWYILFLEMTDFNYVTGSGGENIYSGKSADETCVLPHDDRGLLTTADTGSKASGSQFCITFKPNSHLDRKHTVFGKLVVGSDVLKRIEQVDVQSPDSTPVVPVTIVNCGELTDRKDIGSMRIGIDKKRAAKSKLSKGISSDEESNEGQHKGRRNKSSKRRRKKRYFYSESDSSSESETESSDSESDSDTYSSDSSDVSSSSDDRRRRRKRHSKKNKRKRSRRKHDQRRERRRRKRDRKSKQKSKRIKGDSEAESSSDSSSEDARSKRHRHGRKSKASSQVFEENIAAVSALKDATSPQQKSGIPNSPAQDVSPLQNGENYTNGVNESKIERNAAVMPVLTGNQSKSRSQSMSVNHSMSKSMSISPRRSPMKRSITTTKRSVSRSPVHHNRSGSPVGAPQKSVSRSSARRQSISRSPARSLSKSPPRDASRSPHISRTPVKAHRRSISRSSARSMEQRSLSRSLERIHVRKSVSPRPPLAKPKSITRTPVTSPLRSVSRSPARISRSPLRPSRRSPMRSPRRNIHRSLSRSPARILRSVSRSPVRGGRPRRNISRSPSPLRRALTPPNNGRSRSRSDSPDGSPKRIRRGRGFTQRYSFARQYRSPSADRLHRYGGRNDRDRYMGYRGFRHRSPPRRYRSPSRGRVSSPRYRRRSRSASRSPVHRGRRGGYNKSPVRSRSPPARKRSPSDRARSVSRSHLSRSVSKSPPVHHPSPLDSPSLERASDGKSRSPSPSGGGKKGLVSYGDGTPDSAGK
ncbi:Peptidyl-prolyl cis-trans isomerase CYP95 [Zea mays]|uniref:Peptidyl-prolyl cis-trans isomerase CYP95 n=2 Tax=Zea mays TaxID=4577 RepID=A0A1D6QR20_MAIZE|nr:Peptidyl-prolyl cis-trans isomerase CYP95 [Zea mays]